MIEVKQDSKDKGTGWWSWSVWLHGTKSELDAIDHVLYRLHSTFKNPVRTIRSRNNGFRLDSSGWGAFIIHLEINRKDGKVLKRSHLLKLGGLLKGPSKDPIKPLVFVSSSAADQLAVNAIKEALGAKVEIVDSNSLMPGVTLESSLHKSFQESDAVIAVISDATGTWQDSEISLALESKVPIYPLVIGKKVSLPKAIQGVQSVRVDDFKDISIAATNLYSHMNLKMK